MRIRIAVCLQQGRMAELVDAEMLVRVLGRTHRVAGDAEAAIGTVLEAHRQVQPADQLAMDLRFAGACTDRGPAKQIVEVPGSQRLQQFAGDGQTGFENIQHQPPRQMQPLGHVTAAVQMRIVDQPFQPTVVRGFST